MARVLVIGAGGFVGRHVVFVLWERGLRVVSPRANTTGRQYALLDSPDRNARVVAEEPEILIHLDRVAEHGRFWSSPLYAAWEPASIDFFEQLYSSGGRHAIGIGSCAEYGWTTDAQWFREDMPLGPGKALRLVADMTRLRAEFGFTDSVSFTKGPRTYSEAMP